MTLKVYLCIASLFGCYCCHGGGQAADAISNEDVSAVHETLIARDSNSRRIVEKYAIFPHESSPAHYWHAEPKGIPKAVIVYITGTTVDDLQYTADYYSNKEIEFYGMSWAEINHDNKYELFAPKKEDGIILKAATVATFMTKKALASKKNKGCPIVLVGLSNGGIIATLVNERFDGIDGLIYCMSSGNFSTETNRQTPLFGTGGKGATSFDPLYIRHKKNNIYTILSTNDYFFPILPSYSWADEHGNGNVYVIPNANHSANGIDLHESIVKCAAEINGLEKIEPPIITLSFEQPARWIDRSKKIKIAVLWKGVKVDRILYARGNNPRYSFFFDEMPEKKRGEHVYVLVQGTSGRTGLPVSFLKRLPM